MWARLETILALLKNKFSTLTVSERAAQNVRLIEEKIADAVFNSLQSYDKADEFDVDQTDEVDASDYQEEDYVPVYEDMDIEREFFTYEYISKVLTYVDNHPTHTFATIRTKFRRVKHQNYIARFRQYYAQQGTCRERFIQVAQYTMEQFEFARANSLAVHNDDIRKWALQKARELALEQFSASPRWVENFKRNYRLSSRKVNKFTTHRREADQEEIENPAAAIIVDYVENVRSHYDPPQIFNTDQSGFNYLVYSNRSLSFTGEKKTLVAVQTVNALTHSYTIQPLLNMDGHLVGRLFVNLQEPGGKFGPIVSTEVTKYPNLFVTCTQSGKLNKGLMKTWSQEILKEVLDRTHIDRCVLYFDSWGGQRDASLFRLEGKDVNMLNIPQNITEKGCFH